MSSKSNIEIIENKWNGKKYDEKEFIKFLESLGYSVIDVGFAGEFRRILMKDIESGRILYVKYDGDLIINSFQLIDSREEKLKKNSTDVNYNSSRVGYLIGIGLVAVLILGLIAAMVLDGVNSDDEEEYNPYTEDFDGDGLKGDKDDHDILHILPTMPTEPMDR
jgi:hypothetical protein